MKKILLSIFLAVSIILTNISVIAEEEENAEYQVALDFLSKMNIISIFDNNDDFSAQANVTREEFCVYLSRAFKIEAYDGVEQIFSDVPKDSELAQYVTAMYDRNIVSGYGGVFRPRDVITYNEAVKMLVSTLNYDFAAKVGGYPTGYLSIASSLGITKKVSASEYITKGTAAQLIYNAMLAPIMELAYIDGTTPVFKQNSDESMLTQLYDIYEGKGMILANSSASFVVGIGAIPNDAVLIENTIDNNYTVYKVGNTNASDMLGHQIEFYYRETENDRYEIVSITKDDTEEIVLTSSQNIRFSNNVYTYDDDEGVRRRAYISSDSRLIYNSDYPLTGMTAETMDPNKMTIGYTVYSTMARIRLLKTGNSSDYDVVIIEKYLNHIVSGVDVQNEVIYYKDSTKTDLKAADIRVLNADGKEIDISTIKEWNIVSVLMNTAGTRGVLYVSDKELEGTVSAVGDPDEPKVIISSAIYHADPSVLPNLEAGKDAKVYFDYNGNIAGVGEATSTGLKYGYLFKVKKDKNFNGTGDERVLVEIFNEKGEQKKYYLTEKVKINDVKDTVDNNISTLTGLAENIVKYKVNSSGDIDRMYIYSATSTKYIHMLQNDTSSYIWTASQRFFGGQVTMESGAPVFSIPKDGTGAYSTNPDEYKILGLNSFKDDGSVKAKVFTMGDNIFGEVAVRDATTEGTNETLGIIKKVRNALNEDGEVCVQIEMFYGGSDVTYLVADEIVYRSNGYNDTVNYNSANLIGNLQKGDIVKINTNTNGEIKVIHHLYQYSTDTFIQPITHKYEPQSVELSGVGYRSYHRCLYGYAYNKTKGLLRFTPTDPSTLPSGTEPTDLENALLSGFKIYVIDSEGVHNGSEKDIVDYKSAGNSCSKIIVHTMWANPRDIIIIK